MEELLSRGVAGQLMTLTIDALWALRIIALVLNYPTDYFVNANVVFHGNLVLHTIL